MWLIQSCMSCMQSENATGIDDALGMAAAAAFFRLAALINALLQCAVSAGQMKCLCWICAIDVFAI